MKQRLPDPVGMIERIIRRLNPECSVAKNDYRDYIISMRMQGISFKDISSWLKEQGEKYHIPPTTIHRNLSQIRMEVQLPYAEEMAQKWGGLIDIDLIRETSRSVLIQRTRIDKMLRAEEERQKTSPTYVNRQIRQEMASLTDMIKLLNSLTNVRAGMGEDVDPSIGEITLNEDAESVLIDMIVNGEIEVTLDAAET